MIKRFKRCVSCVLVLVMQFVVSPIAANAAATLQVGSSSPPPSAPKEPSEQNSNSPIPDSPLLRVVNSTGREIVAPGGFVNCALTVANTSIRLVASDVRLMNVLPAGLRLRKGSVQFNGSSSPDPNISADGRALTFIVGDLAPSSSLSINFVVEISADSLPGQVVNVATAFSSGSGISNIAKATVTVRDDFQQPDVSVIKASDSAQETAQSPTVKDSGTAASLTEGAPITSQVAASKSTEAAASSVDSSAQPESSKAAVKEDKQADGRFVVPNTLDLAQLVGKSDVSVLADVDGQFVKNMAENQIIEKEFASQVDEADLLETIRAGRSFNRENLAALARTDQAKAQTGQAFALLLPSVSVRANSGLEISNPSVAVDETTGKPLTSDTHSRTDASLTARQPLFDLPSFRDWRRREVIEKARGESYRVSDGDSYVSAINAYLTLVSSRLQTDMTREFETQLNELLIYIEKRTKAGAASNSDMARVRARSQATLSSRLEQESAHAAAGIEFVRLTCLVPRKVRIPLLEDVGASLLPKSFDLAVSEAMKFNPEIAALTAELQAAEIDMSAAKGRYMPRVDAEYTYGYALHAGGATSSAGQKDQRLMAVLNWNLFSGRGDYNNNVERTARHKELQYRLDDQRRRVVQTLSANYATLTTTRERIASGYQELKSISTAAEAMSKRMLSGNQSLLDLLDVYDRFYQIRSRLVSLHILEMSTVAQLVRLTRGTPETAAKVKAEPSTVSTSQKMTVAVADMKISGDGDSGILAKLKSGAMGISAPVKTEK